MHEPGLDKHNDIQSIQSVFDAIAAEFDTTRYKPWPQTIEFIDALPDNSTVLDLGCGNGRNILYLASVKHGFRIIGLDFSKRMLKIANEKIFLEEPKSNVEFILGDVVKLPLNNLSMDAIIYVAALHHLPTAELRLNSLLELERCLRPGGKAFISVWDFEQERFKDELAQQLATPPADHEFGDVVAPWIGKRGKTFLRFYHLFYRDELENLLAQTKLEVIKLFCAADNYHAVVGKPGKSMNGGKSIYLTNTNTKTSVKTPYELVFDKCKENIQLSTSEQRLLPKKWELLGDVLILKINPKLKKHWHDIAAAYAEILGAKTVLRRTDKIHGTLREPGVEQLLGEPGNTETIHTENKIKFRIDPMRVMFSSGNIDERIRISTKAKPDETVVDMFAGIGYFSLPLAVHSKPKKLIACELNPVAYEYLVQNINLNQVNHIIQPVLGDNRESIPEGVADRIVMGYIKSEHSHREAALKILKPAGGTIHFHDVGFKSEAIDSAFDKVLKSIEKSVFKGKFKAELFNYYRIKSYAPKLVHVVLDILLCG